MLAVRRYSLGILLLALGVAGCDDDPIASAPLAMFRVTEAPSAASAAAVSESRIDVAWQDNSTIETGFEVQRSTTGENGTFSLVATTGAGVTRYSDGGLTPSTRYCYKVRAFRTTGRKNTFSEFSAAACASTTVPTAPSGTDAKPLGSMAIEVRWTDNSIGEDGFRVERSLNGGSTWTTAATPGANATLFSDFNRTSEAAVCYRVFAVHSRGDSPPSNVDCTAPPAAPTDLAATPADAQSADISWTDQSGVEDGYEIQRSLDGSVWSIIATRPAGATSYHDGGLTADTRYWYRARALKDGGASDFSNSDDAVPVGSKPLAPTITYAAPSGSSAVTLYWSGQAPNVEGFRVERSSDGGTTWSTAATTPAYQGGLFDDGRTPEQQVCYRVFAFNRLGDSPPSNTGCATPPAAPTNLVAAPAGNGAIDLTWTDVSRINTGYSVERLVTDCGYYYCYDYWVSIAVLGDVTSYRESGLDPTVFYQYRVVALSDGGQSDPSNEAGSFTEPPPGVPANLTAVAVSSSRVDLAWTTSAGTGQEFVVYRCTGDAVSCGDAGFAFLSWTSTDVTSYSDLTALPATTYSYRVGAYRGGQFSQPSSVASATTPAQ